MAVYQVGQHAPLPFLGSKALYCLLAYCLYVFRKRNYHFSIAFSRAQPPTIWIRIPGQPMRTS